ncbi:mannose-6-phosphate isomerase, class I [Photobacterium satsumensis]|uniref:mannose-6-phosphate isomerase, class I n=1 Tax=Photobacterium satsumensis TaxID=2910239 RepID=UPI003D131EF1
MIMGTYSILGKPRHYAWGGMNFIPSLVGVKNTDSKPFAEWWLGAHPDDSSLVEVNGEQEPLLEWLKSNQQAQAQEERQGEFPLPFLMKILDVNQMLAIQVHPTKAQAEEGFERQDKLGIARTASERTYRDRNDKPEMMVALTPCWLAHGFMAAETIINRFSVYSSFGQLCDQLRLFGVQAAFELLMRMPQSEINMLLGEIIDTHQERYTRGHICQQQPEYWACRAVLMHRSGYDRGLVAMFMMNIVHVPVGKGIYQSAGIPHAYLAGQNIEIMSNSDNVVRIGPTKLHVDLDEVHRLIDYCEVAPKLLSPTEIEGEVNIRRYPHGGTKAFNLSQLMLNDENTEVEYQSSYLSMIFVAQERLSVSSEGDLKKYGQGETFIIPANTKVLLSSTNCVGYIASYGAKNANY